jgi:hypothetical protein
MSIISQEIGQNIFEVDAPHGLRHRLEDLELLLASLLDLHDGGQVVAPVAVVGRAPHRHQILFLNRSDLTLNQWM